MICLSCNTLSQNLRRLRKSPATCFFNRRDSTLKTRRSQRKGERITAFALFVVQLVKTAQFEQDFLCKRSRRPDLFMRSAATFPPLRSFARTPASSALKIQRRKCRRTGFNAKVAKVRAEERRERETGILSALHRVPPQCSRKTGRLIVSQAAGIFSCWAHRNEPNEKRKGGFEQEATERTEIQQTESLFLSFSSVQDFGCGFAALCLCG